MPTQLSDVGCASMMTDVTSRRVDLVFDLHERSRKKEIKGKMF